MDKKDWIFISLLIVILGFFVWSLSETPEEHKAKFSVDDNLSHIINSVESNPEFKEWEGGRLTFFKAKIGNNTTTIELIYYGEHTKGKIKLDPDDIENIDNKSYALSLKIKKLEDTEPENIPDIELDSLQEINKAIMKIEKELGCKKGVDVRYSPKTFFGTCMKPNKIMEVDLD